MDYIDSLIHNYFTLNQNHFIADLMYVLSLLFDWSAYFMLVIILVALIVYFSKGIRSLTLFLSSLGIGTVIVYLLKKIIDAERPASSFVEAYGSSFPSYHATISAIFFIILVYIYRFSFTGKARFVFDSVCYLLIALISLSRVYLGVHWFSDVFFGVLLGYVISHLSIFVFKKVINTHSA